MPLSTETIQNKPLSGRELIEVILNDLRDLLERDGMFSNYIAYRSVAYEIDVRLHTGNPIKPEHTARLRSKPNQTTGTEPFPLPPTVEQKGEMDISRHREVESPNLTRIANSLPITTYVQDKGRTVERSIEYDKTDYPPPSDPVDTKRK